jgi:hypothetical protein
MGKGVIGQVSHHVTDSTPYKEFKRLHKLFSVAAVII